MNVTFTIFSDTQTTDVYAAEMLLNPTCNSAVNFLLNLGGGGS